MDVRKSIKKKIDKFIIENNIRSSEGVNSPMVFQDYILQGRFSEEMVDDFIYDLIGEEDVLISFLGEQFFYSTEFFEYYNIIKSIKNKVLSER